jgi:hypothetical protein
VAGDLTSVRTRGSHQIVLASSANPRPIGTVRRTTTSQKRMWINRSTTGPMTPWWCVLLHRRLWEDEQVFEKPDYTFMRSTSSWCPKCEERRM